ncbi:UvrB/uvrC motif protein [Planctomycetes bacterium MalM25]|nr:UvrB/uvrC motif protein [Planctomycetes bacterium MalM25]
MDVTLDITHVLRDWEFHPEEVTVRLVEGEDGREKVQLRLDLGLMQFERDGRPDGRRIEDFDSWLDLHRARQAEHDTAHPDGAPYQLAPEDCAELLREGVQYYHRYISFWALKKYELCARDTERNLQLINFVRDHARLERDKLQFDQWRPYVIMMHARAVATPLLDAGDEEAGLAAIDRAVERIEAFLSDYNRSEQADQVNELTFLRRWRREVAGRGQRGLPSPDEADDPIEKLRQRLNEAIEAEHYEEAANLRDELERLENPPPPTA